MSKSFNNIRQLAQVVVIWGIVSVVHAQSASDCAAQADRASRDHTSPDTRPSEGPGL